MKILSKVAVLISALAFSAVALATDYTQYCPAISQLHMTQMGSSQLYSYSGTNNAGVTLAADVDNPQYLFTQGNAPQPQSIDSSLTTFISVSNTLRCDYAMINSLGYTVNYPIFNHGSYQECPNGNLVLAGQSCN